MVNLRDCLKSQNSEYYSKFLHIEKIVKNIMPNARVFFPNYTNHDIPHLENVEHLVDKILEYSVESLSIEEIFYLLSAIWLHDIGMIPVNNEKEVFENKNKSEREEFRNNIREEHHKRSKIYIKEHQDELNLNDVESKIIGDICKGHRNVDLSTLKDTHLKNIIKVNSLASVLRLADECDISEERESSLSDEGISENVKKEHYRIHKIVKTVIFNHNSNNILLVANISEENDENILIKRKNKIKDELKNIKPFLKRIDITFEDICIESHFNSKFLERRVILLIAENKNMANIDSELISLDDIEESLEELITSNIVIKDSLNLTEDVEEFKKIFKLFEEEYLNRFFFSDYVQNMIPKCFKIIENNFNLDLRLKDRDSRINILKNSPTAFYFMMFMDDFVKTPNFNISSNQNGDLMFDFILLFGLFNDSHHYSNKINFENLKKSLVDFNFFDKDNILFRINCCKLLNGD